MKTIGIYILTAAALLLGTDLCRAQRVYGVEDVPNVRLSDASQWVSNPDGILSAEAVAQINGEIAEIERTTSVEVAVVAINSIGGDTPEDFAVRLFERWGIGKKGSDNGLLILLVSADRYIRFEVGYGLEGVLTDALCKRIQVQYMNPEFARGDWDSGMEAGVTAVKSYLADPEAGLPEAAPAEQNNAPEGLWFVLVSTFFIVAGSLFSSRMKRRCPRCKAQMDIVDRQSVRISPGIQRVTTTCRCPKCGYVMKKDSTHHTGGGISGGLGGGIGGGFGRGFGGGFGGGSFGGGRSGGGGATSRF